MNDSIIRSLKLLFDINDLELSELFTTIKRLLVVFDDIDKLVCFPNDEFLFNLGVAELDIYIAFTSYKQSGLSPWRVYQLVIENNFGIDSCKYIALDIVFDGCNFDDTDQWKQYFLAISSAGRKIIIELLSTSNITEFVVGLHCLNIILTKIMSGVYLCILKAKESQPKGLSTLDIDNF